MPYTTAPATMHSGHDIRDERGHMVAIVHNPASNPTEGARIAALMAAAPDLLAALTQWAEYAEQNGGDEAYSFNAATRAAIARAIGLTP